MKLLRLGRMRALLALVLLSLVGVGAAFAVGETTGTVSVCADATVGAQTIAVNGAPVATVPAASDHECVTQTYTIPTVTQTVTASTTTAATTTTPAPDGTLAGTIADGSTLSGNVTWIATTTGAVPTKIDYKIDGTIKWTEVNPPYQYNGDPNGVLDTTTLANGSHDFTLVATYADGTTVTQKATATVSNAAAPSLLFDGRAQNMNSMTSTGLYANGNLVQSEDPNLWAGQAYTNDDVVLATDSTVGKVYSSSAEPGSQNPYNTTPETNTGYSELSTRRTETLGDVTYIGLAVKVPSASWNNPDWASIMSLGYETLADDQVALDINPESDGEYFDLMQNSGTVNCPNTGGSACSATTSFLHDKIAKVVYDQWFEFVYAVKWATDNTGFVKVYERTLGGTWSLALDVENEPTALCGTTSYTSVPCDFAGTGRGVLDKFGLYFGYWNASTTSFPKNTIYESGLVQGATLADAENALP